MTFFSILSCNSLKNCYKITVFMNANCNLKPHINLKVRESNSNCAYKYNIEIEEAINSQIQKEHQAATTYLAIAVHFLHPGVSYIGAGGYFMKQYKEELQHMEMFVNYQLMRGGKPVFNEVKSENLCLTLVAAFNQALEMEKNITEHLENIVSLAEAKKDYQSADFITSKFLEHQMQCISELSHHVTMLSKLGDNQHALYHFDQHLSKSYPFSFKS